jgi:hypothetical protein
MKKILKEETQQVVNAPKDEYDILSKTPLLHGFKFSMEPHKTVRALFRIF